MRHTTPEVPDPHFSRGILAHSSLQSPGRPGPGVSPERRDGAGPGNVDGLRWVRGNGDRHRHLVRLADLTRGLAAGHVSAVCGHPIVDEGLTVSDTSTGVPCVACVAASGE